MTSQSAVNFSGPSSENQNEVVKNRAVDLEFEMDLDYLQMAFPCISDDSLADVYTANGGDLDASIDMLNQLEELQCVTLELPSQNLPDSLGIGDISESMSAAECSSVKLKNVVVEVSTRNGSSDSVIIN